MSAAVNRSSLSDVEIEPEIPKAALLTTRRGLDAPARNVEIPAETVREDPADKQPDLQASTTLPKHLVKLAEKRRAELKPQKRQTTIRFEPWLDIAINHAVAKMQLDLNITMSREALITAAVMQYLGVKAPNE